MSNSLGFWDFFKFNNSLTIIVRPFLLEEKIKRTNFSFWHTFVLIHQLIYLFFNIWLFYFCNEMNTIKNNFFLKKNDKTLNEETKRKKRKNSNRRVAEVLQWASELVLFEFETKITLKSTHWIFDLNHLMFSHLTKS